MEACGYPGAKAHQEEQAEFIQHIYELRDRHMRGVGPAINNEALHYLKNWLNHHILIQDMAYKNFVRNNPEADKVARAFGLWFEEDGEDKHRTPSRLGAAVVDAL